MDRLGRATRTAQCAKNLGGHPMMKTDGAPLHGARELTAELRGLRGSAAPAGLLSAVMVETGLADAFFTLDSALGPLLVAYSNQGVTAVQLAADVATFASAYTARTGRRVHPTASAPDRLIRAVGRRLQGARVTVPVDLRGLSDFERATLAKAAEVPRGEVRPYSWIARHIGRPGAVRAVGSALGRNPVPLLIPCHRIVRSDGRVGEYVFGAAAKRAVLASEGLDANELEAGASRQLRYLGSDSTGIYCFPTCRNARRITPKHRVAFPSAAAALAAGFRPCAVCQP